MFFGLSFSFYFFILWAQKGREPKLSGSQKFGRAAPESLIFSVLQRVESKNDGQAKSLIPKFFVLIDVGQPIPSNSLCFLVWLDGLR
jgi:hypothetical protein